MVEHSAPVSVALNRQLLWRMAGASHPIEAHRLESTLHRRARAVGRRARRRRLVPGEAPAALSADRQRRPPRRSPGRRAALSFERGMRGVRPVVLEATGADGGGGRRRRLRRGLDLGALQPLGDDHARGDRRRDAALRDRLGDRLRRRAQPADARRRGARPRRAVAWAAHPRHRQRHPADDLRLARARRRRARGAHGGAGAAAAPGLAAARGRRGPRWSLLSPANRRARRSRSGVAAGHRDLHRRGRTSG